MKILSRGIRTVIIINPIYERVDVGKMPDNWQFKEKVDFLGNVHIQINRPKFWVKFILKK